MRLAHRHLSASLAALMVASAISGCGGATATTGGPPAAAPAVGSASAFASAPAPPPSASSAPAPAPTPPAVATPQSAELAEGAEHRDRHYGGVLTLVLMSLKDLDLSADQRIEIDKIRSQLDAKMAPAREAGKVLSVALADGVAAGSVDRPKVDAAIDNLVKQVQALHDAQTSALNDLHAVLNKEQRARLIDELKAHWEKWKEAHGRDEGEGKEHRAGHLATLVQELKLTKEEAEKIKASFRGGMKKAPQDHAHKEVQDHLQALATAFKAEKFDAKTLTGAKSADVHMARWGATRRARFIEAATPVLTPEQRAKLAQLIRERSEKAD